MGFLHTSLMMYSSGLRSYAALAMARQGVLSWRRSAESYFWVQSWPGDLFVVSAWPNWFFSQMLSVLDFVSVLFVIRCFPRMLQQKCRCLALGSSSSLLEADGYFLVVADIAAGPSNLGWWLSPDFPPACNSAFPSLCGQNCIVAAGGMDLCTHRAYVCLRFFWLCMGLDRKVPS